jgi:ABC-type transport system involved in cytochrome bd biosynthesis fused ATPase/permease subunit
MFDPFIHEDAQLNDEIHRLHSILTAIDPDGDEYQKTSLQLSHLYRLKYERAELILKAQQSHAAHQLECDKNAWSEEQDQRSWFERVDPSTVVTVAGNLVVAIIVVKYEQTGVISSQVRNFIRKI